MQTHQEGSPDFTQAAAHLDWAELRRVTGALDRAQADLEAALFVATRGGMRLHKVDCYLEYVRLHLAFVSLATFVVHTLC